MKKQRVIKRYFLLLFSSTLLISCSSKNNIINFDPSNLPKSNKTKSAIESTKDSIKSENNQYIKDLDIFESKDKLLSKFKIGKKDPFSEGGTQINQFSADFELTGFLNTEIEKFVFVTYKGNEGTISEDSIGGSNTNLLPTGAKVISIDSKKRQLKINFDNEDFIFDF